MSPELSLSHLDIGVDRSNLEELGIKSFIDKEGHRRLSIQVDLRDADGSHHSEAVFDESTKHWKITTPGHGRPNAVAAPSKNSWTESLPKNDNVDRLLNGVDWSQTDLGPLESWPISLRTVVSLVMADTCPAVVYWGPSLVACFNSTAYNDLRQRLNHRTEIQGRRFEQVWQQSWSALQSLFQVMQDGMPTVKHIEVALFPEQPNGRLEETVWSGSLLPVVDEHGKTAGYYNRATDITAAKVIERRSTTLYAISAPAADSNSSIWEHLFNALRSNPTDFPMAFAYSAEDDGATCKLTLEQSLGIPPDGHPLVPELIDIFEGSTGFPFYYRQLRDSHKPIVLHQDDGTLPASFLEHFEWHGYGDTPSSIAIVPISVSLRLLGVLVFGLNPRRPFQTEDEAFINALCRQASATIALAVDREEAHDRAERLTLQLQESEKQIREIAEHGPVGMMRLSPAGSIIWANRQYFEITGHSDTDRYEGSFLDPVHPDDKERITEVWHALRRELKPVSQEIRLHRTWKPPVTTGNPHPKEEHCWLMAHAFPALENGELKSLVCCVTDITRNKWAEELQSRLAVEATEARKLQESFIDVVSHEMRNPLSAITQLADGIADSLGTWASSDRCLDTALRLLEENADYGKTILLCAAHQKRIVDDVLTLSKLDSQLLSITPVVVQPRAVVESVLTMFQAEFETHAIKVENFADDTLQQHRVDYVSVDPARLTQIFINLLTNAIKFTKLEPIRAITVQRAAFVGTVPEIDDIVWFPANQKRRPVAFSAEERHGQPINLLFSVSDTGKGLEKEEMTRLFHRFQQGTKKTHIKYGGSGLGLFISRELTEAMGGQIGLVTEPGKGSTFAFYVKAYQASPPEEHNHITPLSPLSPVSSRHPSVTLAQTDLPVRSGGLTLNKDQHASRLLLVEDNIINAQVLTRQLERSGCIVYNANHGAEALEFLERTKLWHDYQPIQKSEAQTTNLDADVDCILMDVEMPVLGGLACTRRIRELQRQGLLKRHVQIIAITANARAGQIQEAFEAGVDDVLPKPFRVAEVLVKVRTLMEKEREAAVTPATG